MSIKANLTALAIGLTVLYVAIYIYQRMVNLL